MRELNDSGVVPYSYKWLGLGMDISVWRVV